MAFFNSPAGWRGSMAIVACEKLWKSEKHLNYLRCVQLSILRSASFFFCENKIGQSLSKGNHSTVLILLD